MKERVKGVLNYKKPAFWIILTAMIACIILAVCLMTDPRNGFVIDRSQVEKVTYFNMFAGDDCQGELNPAQIDEMADRFSAVSKVKRSRQYEGMTPGYQLNILLKDGSFLYANGYHAEDDMIEIISGGKRYSVSDPAFAEYLRNVCSGGDVSSDRKIEREPFYLIIGSDNVKTIRITTPYMSGGGQNADGSLYRKGEQVWLEPLDECDDLRGVKITAFDENGAVIWTASVPDTVSNKGVTHLTQDGWTISNLSEAADPDSFSDSQEQAEPFMTVTSGGESAAAYPIMLYERTWTENGWQMIDGVPAASEVPEHPDNIPTLTLGDDFSVVFGGGAVRKSGLNIYDEQFAALRESWYGDTALNWLSPGIYYCVIEVHGPLGDYIESEDAYEESAYSCIFRLIVSEEGPVPYMPQEVHDLTRATLHYQGKDYVLTDSDRLQQLTEWFSQATELFGGGACPFGSLLTLTRSDGSEISLCPAEDSCGTVFSDGHYYRYADGNEEFWSLFDIKLFWME